MEKRVIKNVSLILILILYVFIYKAIIFPGFMKYSEIISASFLIAYLGITIFSLGYRKDRETILSQNVFKFTMFYLLITGIVMYALGLATGFLKNAYSREAFTLIDNILSPILIFGLIEFIWYTFIWANKDKKIFIFLITIVLIVFELSLRIRGIDVGDFESIFRLTATTILPVIVKNMFFSYICYHVGFKTILVYRFLVDVLYVYIVPIIPDLGEYVHSVISISLPIIIYMNIYEMIDINCNKPRPLIQKDKLNPVDFVVGVLLVILIALVSGLFPIYMIGIGSNSMKPSINKGDAVILKKVGKNSSAKKGDIIAFDKNDKGSKSMTVVHRVSSVTEKDGRVVYVTKGDANNSEDSNYVREEQVKGIVKLRIPFIAYPTIAFNDFISSRRK